MSKHNMGLGLERIKYAFIIERILFTLLLILLLVLPGCNQEVKTDRSNFTTAAPFFESSGFGANSASNPVAVKFSFSDEPMLGKPIQINFSFAIQKSFLLDGNNAIASIRIPVEAFEVISTDLTSREETLVDHAFNNVPETRYIILEWHGDILKENTYTISANIKAIKTGYWKFEGRASSEQGGGGDDIYVGVFKDRGEIGEHALPRIEGEPQIDINHPELPPVIIPWNQVPPLPSEKKGNTSPSTTSSPSSALDFIHPLTIKGKFVCYVSRDAEPQYKHLDTVAPVGLVWGKYFVLNAANENELGQGLTNRGTGGAFGTNDGEFSITIENPYPTGIKIKIIPESSMAEVKPDLINQTEHYTVTYNLGSVDWNIYSEAVIGTDMNPTIINDEYKDAWRIYETLTNDIYDRGAYYFLHNDTVRGPQWNDIPVVTAYYPYSPIPSSWGEPPFYDAYITHALFFDDEYETKALDSVQHEYGHWVMHYLLYDRALFSPIQPATHYLKQPYSDTIAWSEGWAHFFSLIVQDDPVYENGLGNYDNLETPSGGGWYDGDEVEGRVAGALWDMYDSGSEPDWDEYGIGQYSNGWNITWSIINNTSWYLSDFHDFWTEWQDRAATMSRSDEKYLAVKSIYQNTIDYGSFEWDFIPTWNMISTPLDQGTITVLEFFENILNYTTTIYTFDNQNKSWIQVTSSTLISPGKMYAVSVNQGCDQLQVGIPVEDLQISAYTGWNIIGSIYSQGEIESNPSGRLVSFYGWNGSQWVQWDTDDLQPGIAYQAAVYENCTLNINPVSGMKANGLDSSMLLGDPDCWDVSVSVLDICNKYKYNITFGVHPQATDSFDLILDSPSPLLPPFEEAVEVYFSHPENKLDFMKMFASDYLPTDKDLTWNLQARVTGKSDVKKQVTLSWDKTDIAGVPEKYSLVLLDEKGKELVNMRDTTSYSFEVSITTGSSSQLTDFQIKTVLK